MGTVTAVKSGNWSDTSVWDTGVVPVNGDSVKAASYTITFDVDINQPLTVLEATSGNFRYSGTGTRTVVAQANVGNHTTGGLIQNTSTGTLVFDGAVRGGSGTNAYGANNATSSGTLTVTTATGGSGNSAHGASNASSGTLTVTTATGGSGTNAYGAYNASSGTLNCDLAVGNNYGPGGTHSNNNSGVVGLNIVGQVTTVKRIQFGPYGAIPVTGAVLLLADATNSAQFRTALNGATKTLTDTSAAADYPATADVRAGKVYANTDRTGTLAVPAANQVAVGIAVDATTGTAVLTQANAAAAVWNAARGSYTTDGTFGDVAEWAGSIDTGAIATAVRSELTTELGRIDATVSSRLAASAYVEPDPVDVAAIADAVWNEAIPGTFPAGSAGVVVSNIETQLAGSAASIAAALADTTLDIYRGDSWSANISDLGSLTGRTKLYWTVKRDAGDADADALVQVEETAGLVRLNGAASTAGNGDIAVTDAAVGDITLTLAAAATAALTPGSYVYDVQMVTASGVTTLGTGVVNVTADVTRATS